MTTVPGRAVGWNRWKTCGRPHSPRCLCAPTRSSRPQSVYISYRLLSNLSPSQGILHQCTDLSHSKLNQIYIQHRIHTFIPIVSHWWWMYNKTFGAYRLLLDHCRGRGFPPIHIRSAWLVLQSQNTLPSSLLRYGVLLLRLHRPRHSICCINHGISVLL